MILSIEKRDVLRITSSRSIQRNGSGTGETCCKEIEPGRATWHSKLQDPMKNKIVVTSQEQIDPKILDMHGRANLFPRSKDIWIPPEYNMIRN